MNFNVKVPGSCGELVQGMIDDIPFLVTCPIDMYAKAGMTGYFSYLPYKAKLARRKTLDYLKTKSLRKFCLMTQLLTGKGMASSSADIAAVCQITALSAGKQLTECEIAQIAASIEPTDGVFCRGVVAINYQTGKILHSFGVMPALAIAMFDLGGTVDTLAFHRQYDEAARMYSADAERILPLLTPPYTAEHLGAAATYSALAHQRVVCKLQLPALLEIGKAFGAVGVNIGHSGTVCGLLFSEHCSVAWLDDCVGPYIAERLAAAYMGAAVLSSGGWTIERR